MPSVYKPIPWELRKQPQAFMRLALRFARLMLDHSRVGLTGVEIAEELDITVRHAHRLVRAAIDAGWPLERETEKRAAGSRWRLIS